MRKKLLIAVLALVCAFSCAVYFSGCLGDIFGWVPETEQGEQTDKDSQGGCSCEDKDPDKEGEQTNGGEDKEPSESEDKDPDEGEDKDPDEGGEKQTDGGNQTDPEEGEKTDPDEGGEKKPAEGEGDGLEESGGASEGTNEGQDGDGLGDGLSDGQNS